MNLKELQQLIKLCRKSGIDSIKYEGIELVFGSMPSEGIINKRSTKRYIQPGQVTENDKIVKDETAWDQLTPEQQMFFSSAPSVDPS